MAVEVGIKLLPKGFQHTGARVETRTKNSWQSETEGFLFIPEGEMLGMCTDFFGVSADDLEDKEGVH